MDPSRSSGCDSKGSDSGNILKAESRSRFEESGQGLRVGHIHDASSTAKRMVRYSCLKFQERLRLREKVETWERKAGISLLQPRDRPPHPASSVATEEVSGTEP